MASDAMNLRGRPDFQISEIRSNRFKNFFLLLATLLNERYRSALFQIAFVIFEVYLHFST